VKDLLAVVFACEKVGNFRSFMES